MYSGFEKEGTISLLCVREDTEPGPRLKNMRDLLAYPLRLPFLSVCVYRKVLLL